jgi:penicillin-binding protein 2
MLIFDQLKHDNRKLRAISMGVAAGLLILLAGLWWVQIVSAKRYEENLKNQSFRSVRVPALRGSILDRNGQRLAENRPRFDVNLYLEDLRPQFTAEYPKVVRDYTNSNPGVKIRSDVLAQINREARYRVVSNIVSQVSSTLQQPYILDPARFSKHYSERPYIPFPAMQNLTPRQVAIFAENFTGMRGVEMEMQPMRTYPNGSSAAHLLGYIQRHDKPADDDEIAYKYYLPDFIGRTGVEASFDDQLRGKAGVKSLLVNNIGYRQREEMLNMTETGQTLALTIDSRIQRAAETALAGAMANVRGAVVVMDVRNGDVLALASLPAFDPNVFPTGVSSTEWNRLNNEKYSYMFNRATYGAYPPGSILKILTAIACFESNVVNPSESFHEPGYYENSKLLGRRRIKSLAPPGDYDFRRAFIKSSNTYFIHYGLKAGLKKLVEVGERFHMGETTGILPGEEVAGDYPHSNRLAGWYAGNTANLCIGQEITVTPIQVAAMISAIANGGKLWWPRIIRDLRPADALETDANSFQPGSLRSNTKLNPRHLELIHRAMLADVEDNDGTGTAARVEGFRVGGKTGTAEGTKEDTTWFASFGPAENPRYSVVVMVQGGSSGGGTCAPVAGKIYKAILNLEQTGTAAPKTLAELN